ncbi:hypothetical protein FA09DRAFT_330108 [Tilletiopsis washingtonensis]|uniref:Uncharacterized protein n=1 Tax=Tilletiopsis washingtonensis TaxID=58919 RepID=A0A316Z832_9BASI|nr:hypothetical protein FA09DRAFT_330108 [Tilletiopsis washingtonensis]PWN97947.1 hypothetical protein FA09DRAFT_330108 [Tilletiopsis washingtonensis]
MLLDVSATESAFGAASWEQQPQHLSDRRTTPDHAAVLCQLPCGGAHTSHRARCCVACDGSRPALWRCSRARLLSLCAHCPYWSMAVEMREPSRESPRGCAAGDDPRLEG